VGAKRTAVMRTVSREKQQASDRLILVRESTKQQAGRDEYVSVSVHATELMESRSTRPEAEWCWRE